MSAIKRRDGTIIAVPFRPKYPPDLDIRPIPPTVFQFKFTYHTSTNNGTTWNTFTDDINGGTIRFTSPIIGFRFHRGVIEENDGSLYAPAYVNFWGEPRFRIVIMKSVDRGVTWDHQPDEIDFESTLAYTESSLVKCANGEWLVVMRADQIYQNAAGNPYGVPRQLRQRRRSTAGVWGPVIETPGLVANGVDPLLTLMPNGILVLSFGHDQQGADDQSNGAGRNTVLTFSTDNGNTWTAKNTTFTGVSGGLESTGYTAIVPITAHRFLQITDTGIDWSYLQSRLHTEPQSI